MDALTIEERQIVQKKRNEKRLEPAKPTMTTAIDMDTGTSTKKSEALQYWRQKSDNAKLRMALRVEHAEMMETHVKSMTKGVTRKTGT